MVAIELYSHAQPPATKEGDKPAGSNIGSFEAFQTENGEGAMLEDGAVRALLAVDGECLLQ